MEQWPFIRSCEFLWHIDNKDEARGESPISEFKDAIPALDNIQANMFKKADDAYRAHRV